MIFKLSFLTSKSLAQALTPCRVSTRIKGTLYCLHMFRGVTLSPSLPLYNELKEEFVLLSSMCQNPIIAHALSCNLSIAL